ncbi:MAG: formate dehydrogenase subunit alpha [Actinobacteria bacterium]|nr:formate dehydrogenase subunit alpha [Actinomycetota bacterium]
MITLTIDGNKVHVPEGITILEAAKSVGIRIPNLCNDKRLHPFGACRLCLVEVEGARGLPPACATIVSQDMVVRTNTEQLQSLRKNLVELILSDHPLDCLTCEQSGNCKLQNLAYAFKMDSNRFVGEHFEGHYFSVDDTNPLILRDNNKCILCGRCVRICEEVETANAIGFAKRGFESVITTPYGAPLQETPCEFCGQCVSTCPVGALTEKMSLGKGRVWECEQVVTTCPYCGCGCQLVVHTKDNQIVKVTSDVKYGVNKGNLCIKGRFGFDFVNHPDRLKTPLIKKNGEFIEASWDEALDLVHKKLSEVKNKNGPNAIGGLSSAKCTNEENYLMQKFIRAVIGTNNVDHCARLCHASTVAGLAKAFGSGAMTNSIGDIADSKVILVIGSNTTEAHPIIGLEVRKAVKHRGAKLIVIDPRKIRLVELSTIWLSQRPGTDVAVINGLMNVILEEGLINKKFIGDCTIGFDEVEKIVKKYTPEMVEKISGIQADDLRQAARLFAEASDASIIYSMGITQHSTGTDNVLSIANLAMLTGNIGRPGAGVNPLRGQNNVQGACDMGALPNVFPGYQKIDNEDARKKFEEKWKVKLDDKPGLTVVEMINAAREGKLKALYIMGENPMLSDPDINHVKEGLGALDFLVVQDIFLTETARLADVVLPGVSFAEKNGTFTNTERRVQRIHKVIEPLGEAKEDREIISELSRRFGYEMNHHTAGQIMDEIASVTPSYGGINYQRLKTRGLQWPCPDSDHPGTPILHSQQFTCGKGIFHPVGYIAPAEEPDKDYPMILTTGRILVHYHTGTMTRRSKGIEELCSEGCVEINPKDADKLKIKKDDWVKLTTRRGEIKIKAKVTRRSPVGTVFVAFHFSESPANALTNSALDPVAKIPEFKVCAVRVERA